MLKHQTQRLLYTLNLVSSGWEFNRPAAVPKRETIGLRPWQNTRRKTHDDTLKAKHWAKNTIYSAEGRDTIYETIGQRPWRDTRPKAVTIPFKNEGVGQRAWAGRPKAVTKPLTQGFVDSNAKHVKQ
jgi:hypothetical protein